MIHRTFECFPIRMVVIAEAVLLAIYLVGAYIMFKLGAFWGWLFLICCLFQEMRIMRLSCVNCHYYGKLCGFGKGTLAALFFKKGDPQKFIERKITWKDLIPDFLVSLIPFMTGIYLLFTAFSWIILILIILLFLLTTGGNAFVRGGIVCKYCQQKDLGCPAEKLFAKKNQ